MPKTIALIGAGAMGSAVGRRLVEQGHVVTTVLEGRSAASRQRAESAGMRDGSWKAVAAADFILSILPPSEALHLAERLAPAIAAAAVKPVYIDCNAVSPATMQAIAAALAPTGAAVIDAGIIGGPPKKGEKGPAIYASGPAARTFANLETGLDIRVLEGPVGAASALKMCYAGLNKGLITLGSVVFLAAARAGASSALLKQLDESNPDILASLRKQIPTTFAKAYRFVGEMQEISAFLSADDPGGAEIYQGAARFYERLAADVAGDGEQTAILAELVR